MRKLERYAGADITKRESVCISADVVELELENAYHEAALAEAVEMLRWMRSDASCNDLKQFYDSIDTFLDKYGGKDY